MINYKLSEEDLTEIKKRFPELRIKQSLIFGVLGFNSEFDNDPIKDCFQIIIGLSDKDFQIPFLSEQGGRTQAIAKKYNLKSLRELHCNPNNGVACLCVKQEEKRKFPDGSSIIKFIDDLVIPYLYGLSFYEKNRRWPWHEFSHGCLGLLEFYEDDKIEKTPSLIKDISIPFKDDLHWKEYRNHLMKPKEKRNCPCESGIPFSDCHTKAWEGLLLLQKDLKNLRLDAYKLFSK